MEKEIEEHIQKIALLLNEATQNEVSQHFIMMFQTNPQKLIELSSHVVLRDNSPNVAVQYSFIFMRHCSNFISSNWYKFPLVQRDFIKTAVVRGLFFQDLAIRNIASVIFALISKEDIRFSNSSEIIRILTEPIINDDYPIHSKVGCLIALSEVIRMKLISPENDNYERSFQIIGQLIFAMLSRTEEFQNETQIAMQNFLVIFPFYGPLFSRNPQIKREMLNLVHINFAKYINNKDFYCVLYKFLAVFFEACYDTIGENMEHIFQMSVDTFSASSDGSVDIIVPMLNFWIDVSSFEARLIKEKHKDNKEGNKNDALLVQNVIMHVAPSLLQPIIRVMIISSSATPVDDLSGEVNLCHIAADCLWHFSVLSPSVFSFMDSSSHDELMSNQDWRARHASVILLWCVTAAPNYIDQVEFFRRKFDRIVGMLDDDSFAVKDATLWILEVLFSKYKEISTNKPFIKVLMTIVSNFVLGPTALAVRVCDLINRIGRVFRSYGFECPLFEAIFQPLMKMLFVIFDRTDACTADSGLELHCTEAISSVIQSAPRCHEEFVVTILEQTIQRIISDIKSFGEEMAVMVFQKKLQGFCIIIWAIAHRLGPALRPFTERIVPILLRVLEMRSMICQGDGLIAMSAIINSVGDAIRPYITNLVEIFRLSQQSGQKEIIQTSATMILCLYRTNGNIMAEMKIGAVNTEIVEIFVEKLKDDNLDIESKIKILFALSEMVKVLKDTISPAYETFVAQLTAFQNLVGNSGLDDESSMNLCEALLRGYASLIISSAENDYINIIVRNYKQITFLFMKIVKYSECATTDLKKETLCFLETVLETIAKRVNMHINKRCVLNFVEKITKDEDESLSFRAKIVLYKIKNS